MHGDESSLIEIAGVVSRLTATGLFFREYYLASEMSQHLYGADGNVGKKLVDKAGHKKENAHFVKKYKFPCEKIQS